MNRLDIKTRTQILGLLVEGNSLRATSRLADVSINTVTKLLVDVGQAASEYQDTTLRNLNCKRVQVDEIWSFVGAKEKNATPEQRAKGFGDIWTWTAIDADTKLVPSWLVGERDIDATRTFIDDLASRLAGRIQLSSDGYRPYLEAVDTAFGEGIDYAILHKKYDSPIDGARKYSPAVCIGAEKHTVYGEPDVKHINTSFVERQNLTMHMSSRRFTRLTNGFSKKVENHGHAVALHFMFYNFGRIHKTLHVTPAMAAGVANHVWSLEEIADLAVMR